MVLTASLYSVDLGQHYTVFYLDVAEFLAGVAPRKAVVFYQDIPAFLTGIVLRKAVIFMKMSLPFRKG